MLDKHWYISFCVDTCFHFLWVYIYLGAELLDPKETLCWTFWETATQFSKVTAIYNLHFTDKPEAQRGEVSYAKPHAQRAGANHISGLNSTCPLSSDFTTIYLTVTPTLLMPTLPLHSFPHPAANPLTLVLLRGLHCHIGIKFSSVEWFTSSLPSGSAVTNQWSARFERLATTI